ncbi:hypothetical protein, partial [Escherichia coli]|uniref:hypothetical protein n=1 Tax=Escherichia coli TaxID=562 RepID=UPI003EE31477
PYIVINLMLKTESKYGRLIKLRAVFSRYTNKNTCEVISPYISRNVIGVARVECDVDKLIGCRI